jgi:hypothetical protein
VADELGRAGPSDAGGADAVTAPDQHKPTNLKWARVCGVLAIIVMLVLTQPFNNHEGWVADVFLLLTAGIIALLLIADVVLRRNGLRR